MPFRRSVTKSCFLVFALTLTSTLLFERLFAQQSTDSMGFMQRENASMTEMDRAMKAAPMNGNVDHDFVTMMLPHHQGAIDMAKSELLFGKDPTMRRLAQEIIVDQQSEIDAMNLWLSKHPGAQPKGTNK
jgi:uncharacterized protein (DUF305 family)